MTTTSTSDPHAADPRFESIPALRQSLREVDYLSDEGIAAVADVGYVPLTADALDATRQAWAVSAEAAT